MYHGRRDSQTAENGKSAPVSVLLFVLILFILHAISGRVQRLSDPAMLTQGSQGVCHRNDTERGVSIHEESQ